MIISLQPLEAVEASQTFSVTGQVVEPAPVDVGRLLQIAVNVVGFIAVAYMLWRQGKIDQAKRGLVDGLTSDPNLTALVHSQYLRLPLHLQTKLSQIIDVLDPATKTTASDLDDDIVEWFMKVIGKI